MTGHNFRELIARLRAGDAAAAEELHRQYGEQLRRIIRVRLTDPNLRRQIDSVDICQSVFADFFVRMAVGEFDISDPDDLLKLLSTMARNRLIHHANKHKAARRDIRRTTPLSIDEMNLPAAGETPSQIISSQELVAKFLTCLSKEDRSIAEQRRAGRTWEEIAADLGRTGEAVRKQFSRAVREISQQLGMDDTVE